MASKKVNIHSVKSAKKGAKFLAPMTVMTTLVFLFLVMGVDVFILKAVAEPLYSIWWYLFWGAAIVLFLLSLSGAIGLVFSLFSAAIATIVDQNKTKATIVMVGVLITGVASFLIRSAKSEDLRALEARAVAFHDPVFQEKVQSKQRLQDEITRLNNDRKDSNDDQIPPLQDKISVIDNELASLSDKYSNEARLADAALWLIILSCVVSVIIDFAYTYCVQKGWGDGHYSVTEIRQEAYSDEDGNSSPNSNSGNSGSNGTYRETPSPTPVDVSTNGRNREHQKMTDNISPDQIEQIVLNILERQNKKIEHSPERPIEHKTEQPKIVHLNVQPKPKGNLKKANSKRKMNTDERRIFLKNYVHSNPEATVQQMCSVTNTKSRTTVQNDLNYLGLGTREQRLSLAQIPLPAYN